MGKTSVIMILVGKIESTQKRGPLMKNNFFLPKKRPLIKEIFIENFRELSFNNS